LEVAGEPEAKAIVMEDPAVKSGIFVYELHPGELKPRDKYSEKAKAVANKALCLDVDSLLLATSGEFGS
jgi:hypothetical protein